MKTPILLGEELMKPQHALPEMWTLFSSLEMMVLEQQ